MSPTAVLEPELPLTDHRSPQEPEGPIPTPRLAQIQAITASGATRPQAAELLAALGEHAATHNGLIGLIDMGDTADHWSTEHVSLWRSVSDLRDFVHASHPALVAWQHRTGLRVTTERALWWVTAPERVTPEEARERLDHLRRNGPTRHAFTLRSPVPPPRG
ncbi:DUF3291 domain-containing protein [Halostreptopolyspora alba]|uniref:DUF3291 domain-containing protein n=1 Tax=Halostreptopolyspora alba TaxID=2487137 RepID=A0A3N0E6G8_9ACTN|nr:DUF3291 domain-containing protein [Nocardiopsaceae bacterium YIM 96095]